MGPTLFVHLPQTLSREDIEWLDEWIAGTTVSPERAGDDWRFWIDKETCQCSLAVVPFGAESAGNGQVTDVYLEEDEQHQYEALLGWRPRVSLQMDNFCRSDKRGHVLLAKMATDLARKWNGLASLGDAVAPLLLIDQQPGEDRAVPLPPGMWYVLAHRFPDEEGFDEYLVDAAFLEYWTQHPDFHLAI